MADTDDIAKELAARDRLRKHLGARKTPADRLRDMARLQQGAWQLLRNSPEGYARFLRRNFKARAIRTPPHLDPHAT